MNLLEALRYLVALQQHRHFGRAAQACRITQPALSNAIRALESHFKVAIVRRSRQYEGLTPEGAVVLAHAHRLLHEAEALHQALASRADAPQGRLQLGAVPSAMPVAARFAARLQALHPGLLPVLRSLSSAAIDAGLDNLSLDLALGYSSRPEVLARKLAVWPQYGEHYFLVQHTGAAAALAFGPALPWADAADLPLVLLTPDMHHRQRVDAAFATAGRHPTPAIETDSVLALLVALQRPGLAAVLPGALVDCALHTPGLLARPLCSPAVCTPMAFLSHGTAPPTLALQAALALLQGADWQAEVYAHSGALGTAEDRFKA